MSLKFVLLTLLDRQPRTGYDLVQTFDTAVGYFWSASHQQVYRELGTLSESKLVKFRLVEQTDKPDKKIYRISTTGKQALMKWLEEPIKPSKIKDLLLVKLLNSNSDNIGLIHEELDRDFQTSKAMHNTYLEIEKAHFSVQSLKALPDDQIMIYAALRKGILSIEAHISWIDEVKKLTRGRFK